MRKEGPVNNVLGVDVIVPAVGVDVIVPAVDVDVTVPAKIHSCAKSVILWIKL